MYEHCLPDTKGLIVDWEGQKYELLENVNWCENDPGKSRLDSDPGDLENYFWPVSCEAQCCPLSLAGQDTGDLAWTAYFSFTADDYSRWASNSDVLQFFDGILSTGDD